MIGIVTKLMRNFIRDALLQFLTSSNILTIKQHGFIKGSLITLKLLAVMDKWAKILIRGD